MKSFVKFVLVAVGVMGVSSAQAFQIQADYFVSPHYVQATACNSDEYLPITCRTTAVGVLPSGKVVKAWVNLFLMPGQCDHAYVYANAPLFFVDGSAQAYCNFVR